MNKFHSESVDTLVKGLLKLETEEECYAFLEDVCTIKELQDMAQRFDVALKLSDGFNYNQVSAATGASSATISRVNKCLMYGNNGYNTIIERLKEEKLYEQEDQIEFTKMQEKITTKKSVEEQVIIDLVTGYAKDNAKIGNFEETRTELRTKEVYHIDAERGRLTGNL